MRYMINYLIPIDQNIFAKFSLEFVEFFDRASHSQVPLARCQSRLLLHSHRSTYLYITHKYINTLIHACIQKALNLRIIKAIDYGHRL